MRGQLVSPQVMRCSESTRTIPVYVLTNKGRDVVALLVVAQTSCPVDTCGL